MYKTFGSFNDGFLRFLWLAPFIFREAEVLDHSKNPCTNRNDFVPSTKDKTYIFYIRMDHASDWITWFNIARCLKIWDLDARGFHKSLWRLWLNESHVLIVGCPASPHCAHKSSDVIPIDIQNKVTRPPDWKTLLSGLWLTCRVVSRVSRSLHPKPLLKKIVTLWKRRWREGPWVASFPGFPPRRKPWELQYSSQILKHLCDFPLPQCWFGYYSRLTASKYAWLNIAEGEGQM